MTSSSDRLLLGLQVVGWGLFFSRFLIPAESAGDGDTVLIPLLWLLLTAAFSWLSWRGNFPNFLKFDRIDAGVGLLCASMVIAGGAAWVIGSHPRQTGNFVWEWIGTFLAVYWLRQFLRSSDVRLPTAVLIGLIVTLAGQGIYQHHWELPRHRSEATPLIEQWQALPEPVATAVPSAGIATDFSAQRQQQRRAELERELFRMGVPTEKRAQRAFLERLNSSEPFAAFALTNTLAGVLAVGFVLLFGLLIEQTLRTNTAGGSRSAVLLLIIGGMAGVVGYCLMLTKSRTAWVGAAVGIAYLLFCLVATRVKWRTFLGLCLGLVLVTAGLIGIGLATGSLDREVATEIGKSLQYRIEYWSSSLAMLQDRWWWGTGPGNFRQHYLAYKLPYSSEEILDPHNFWLEAWSSGGLLGLAALVWLMGMFLWQMLGEFRQTLTFAVPPGPADPPAQIDQSQVDPLEKSPISRLAGGLIIAISLLFAGLLPSPQLAPLLENLLLYGVVWGVCFVLLSRVLVTLKVPPVLFYVAAGTMLIHLHGAGGFSMPVIWQLTLLLCFGFAGNPGAAASVSRRSVLLCGGCAAGLAILGVWGVVSPKFTTVRLQAELAEAQSTVEQIRLCRQWIDADRLSPEPWLLLAQIVARAELAGESVLQQVEQARQIEVAFEEAIRRNPANYFERLAYAEYLLERAKRTDSPADFEVALTRLEESLARYPQHLLLHRKRVEFLEAMNDRARLLAAVERTLELNAILTAAGHLDRVLSSGEHDRLTRLEEQLRQAGN